MKSDTYLDWTAIADLVRQWTTTAPSLHPTPVAEPEAPTVPKPAEIHDRMSPWPANLPGLGTRTVDAFVPCRLCSIGTWARFGAMPLCLACARQWPGASTPEEARTILHMLLMIWSTMDEGQWTRAEVNALKDQILGFWSDHPKDADQWFAAWRRDHPEARLG